MATKTDTLKIKLKADGAGKVKTSLVGVEKDLDGVGSGANRAGKAMGGLKSVVGLLAATLATGFLIKTIVEFQKLEASLKTVTGSTAEANQAFGKLKAFARETPDQLGDVVGAFIKLKALGLDPSIESLRSYGNTAAAMGKSLNQFIEAVADAATGEFERLKEFGIKSRSQGDNVSFTFQGITTTVKKNAGQIEKYLKKIGDTTFSGALADQMDTLGGSFSNFQDSVSQLATAIGKSGVSNLIQGITNASADLIRTVAGLPKPMAELRRQLALIKSSNGKVILSSSGRGGIIGGPNGLAQARKDIEDALIFAGGPNGLRIQIDRLDNQIQEIEKRLANFGGGSTSGRGVGSGIKTLLNRLKSERNLVENSLVELELTPPEQTKTPTASPVANKKAASVKARRAKERAAYVESLQGRFQALQTSFLNEEQLIDFNERKKIDLLDTYQVEVGLSEREHQDLLTEIQREASEQRLALVENENRAKLQIATGAFQNLASLMGSQSKKEFEIGKKAAIAGALIKGYQAIVNSYEAGTKVGGPWVGAAYAATAAIATKMQIDAIKRQQFRGGGTIPSVSGGNNGQGTQPASTPAVNPQGNNNNNNGTRVTVVVMGNNYGFDDFNSSVVDAVQQAVGNDVELIAPDSRNGIDLIEAAIR